MADAPTSAEQVSFGVSAGIQPEEAPRQTDSAASGAVPVRAKAADNGPSADRLLAASKGVRSYGTLGTMPRRAERYTWHPDSMRFTAHVDGDTVELPLLSLRASRTSRRRRKALKLFLIYASIFVLSFVMSLDAMTSFLYLNYACSEFGTLSALGTVAIMQQLVCAVSKPTIAKFADLAGRMWALVIALVLYCCGYAWMSMSNSLGTLLCGVVIQALGYTGAQVLQSVIIADTTAAKWRGLVIGLNMLPFMINFTIAGPLANVALRYYDWRTGYRLWVVLGPIAALPLLTLLIMGHRRARRAAARASAANPAAGPAAPEPAGDRARKLVREMDLVGMSLFSSGLLLILLPFSMNGFSTHSSVFLLSNVGLLSGVLFLVLFGIWETRVEHPFLPYQLLFNGTVMGLCVIGLLDFAGFFLSWTYLSAFIQVIENWDQTRTAYLVSTQTVVSTIASILIGSLMVCLGRYKACLVSGLVVRLVGVALMVHYRSVEHTPAMLVACQVLQGFGGGMIAVTMQVPAQHAVSRSKVALVTALELFSVEVGAAIGTSLASAIFTTVLPGLMRRHLSWMEPEELAKILGSLREMLAYPMESPVRIGASLAWSETMQLLCLVAFLVQVPALFVALVLPDANLHERSTPSAPAHRYSHPPSTPARAHQNPVRRATFSAHEAIRYQSPPWRAMPPRPRPNGENTPRPHS